MYCVRYRIKISSIVCLCALVSPNVPEMEGTYATGGILFFFFFFEDVPLVEFIHLVFYSHARWSYRRRFRSLLLCPLSVERYYFPMFVDSQRKELQYSRRERTNAETRVFVASVDRK